MIKYEWGPDPVGLVSILLRRDIREFSVYVHIHTHTPSKDHLSTQEKGSCLQARKTVIKCKSVCPMHSEAKQYQNIRIWSRERLTAGPCKETSEWLMP